VRSTARRLFLLRGSDDAALTVTWEP